MSLRLPSTAVDRAPSDPALCEHVFTIIHRRCGTVVDRERIEGLCEGDPRLRRYVRDVLALFASLGQVEHVRRDLWIIPPLGQLAAIDEEYLRATVAARANGGWFVVGGAWSLVLHGLLAPKRLQSLRFGLSPRPARASTRSAYGQRARDDGRIENVVPGTSLRHVTHVRNVPIATVSRPADRLGEVRWLERGEHGAHAQSIGAAFVTMFESPRLSGGARATIDVVLPVLGRIGIDAVLALAEAHPSVAVRRRIAFVLVDALARSNGTTCWMPPDEHGDCDDIEQSWYIDRRLDIGAGNRPTLLEPHRLPLGPKLGRFGLIDNREAPLARPTRGPQGMPVTDQVRLARIRAREEARVLDPEQEALEREIEEARRRRGWT